MKFRGLRSGDPSRNVLNSRKCALHCGNVGEHHLVETLISQRVWLIAKFCHA
jgi:hypothetical protein